MYIGRLRTCQKLIVIGIGTGFHPLARLYPPSLFTNRLKRSIDFASTAVKAWTPDDFFIFGENIAAHAKEHVRLRYGAQKYLSRRASRI